MRLLLTFCSLAFCLPSVSNLTQKGWPGQCATTFLTMTGSLRWSNLKQRLLVLWIIPGVTKDLWMKDRERKLYNSTNTPPSQPWHRVESSVPSQVAEQLAYYVHVSETPYREKSIKDNYTSNMYRYLASLTVLQKLGFVLVSGPLVCSSVLMSALLACCWLLLSAAAVWIPGFFFFIIFF
ncbi:uncharacterized protein LOC122973242 isoform X7 [Thunnus albacares]|uniref:uncharacterized protein LOC122973242 isoform X7 n=1 Tax=Thunnus albacares TaxID=8236 RepID=UPI001CF6E319|nr:uncharacterized protein LOC122973242 isoform X7 [Thunnus albacares]